MPVWWKNFELIILMRSATPNMRLVPIDPLCQAQPAKSLEFRQSQGGFLEKYWGRRGVQKRWYPPTNPWQTNRLRAQRASPQECGSSCGEIVPRKEAASWVRTIRSRSRGNFQSCWAGLVRSHQLYFVFRLLLLITNDYYVSLLFGADWKKVW